MRRAWMERLTARFVIVVGKGGVGKTTTSGALALAMADAGAATHLVSVDPAHSLADLFQLDTLGRGQRASPCTPLLTLEEFDASAFAASWIAAHRGAALELMRHGTYFDDEDSRRILDLSLPGLDEVAAALRLVELADGPAERIVVDTAPTGHLLRLLQAGDWLAGWTAAFRAMAAKASAVAGAMLRQPVRLSAEERIDEVEAAVERFRAEILSSAEFVVVSRSDAVVVAETERLEQELERRGLRVAARVRTGPGPDGFRGWTMPEMNEPRGCESLRGWGAEGRGPAVVAAASRGASSRRAARFPAPRELLFFAGKGGVGKSTCAAAAALALSGEREVVLLGTDPAGSLGDVFGLPVSGEGVQVTPGLFAQQADPSAAGLAGEWSGGVERLLERLGLGGSAGLDRAVLESLWDAAPPGMDELTALLALVDHHGAGRLLVVDTAPTGHFLRLLQLPEHALAWTHALLRIMMKYGASLGLDDPVRRVLRFAKQLRQLRLALGDPARVAVVLVTLAEGLVDAETRRLAAALDRAGIATAATVLNRAPPEARPAPGQILAPELARPPVGPDALRDFFSRWEQAL